MGYNFQEHAFRTCARPQGLMDGSSQRDLILATARCRDPARHVSVRKQWSKIMGKAGSNTHLLIPSLNVASSYEKIILKLPGWVD